ncbi:choline ABC transporter ATP-binding protein [Lichenihabitans sp. Uapishka_5]|uniref:choline ABC transporter ATP-binding protein n=1 Tax=Lichenihabitans sp. Uapishka_5 TaxID=3037302 RepID=UPI0029E7DB2D|nr:choline ABC transporter ATP-binding protein [Lichenihabitans sp. Uapishka_5]MDX7949918.1 choline ABC transporter ATP-binding protein [Lichenihabitans sp. Uapishka_5]
MSAAVTFRDVDIVFGRAAPGPALALLDQGRTREEILAETGQVIGVAKANLSVDHGEICVLMGLSGSGKSTLLRAVNRLNVPARGDVLVDVGGRSVNVSTCDARSLRALRGRSVAMVFQQFALLPWRSVRDNVGLGLELRGLSGVARNRIVDEKLAMVGLDRWADKYAHELSGGMQQRVGLARAFATDADILLMDEPFSALDPLIRTKLQDELLALQSTLKKTILFVSHDLDEAIKLGNRIVIMEGGRIVQAGTAEDILLRPADAYVAEFVRHVNPLEALRASAIMTPLATLPRTGQVVTACQASGLQVVVAEGQPIPLRIGTGATLPVASSGLNGHAVGAEAITIPADMPLRQAIALRQVQNCPLLVVDAAGALLGAIGEADIYRALLR